MCSSSVASAARGRKTRRTRGTASSGKFMRWFSLLENAKADQVKAGLENGVLTVTVPKAGVKKLEMKAIIRCSSRTGGWCGMWILCNGTSVDSVRMHEHSLIRQSAMCAKSQGIKAIHCPRDQDKLVRSLPFDRCQAGL
jgi:hypothetical protein